MKSSTSSRTSAGQATAQQLMGELIAALHDPRDLLKLVLVGHPNRDTKILSIYEGSKTTITA